MEVILNLFSERCKLQRKTSREQLSLYSLAIARAYGELAEKNFNFSQFIDTILYDAEIYHDMPVNKAIDAMIELGALAGMLVNRDNQRYDRLCILLDLLRNSYPLSG